MTQTAFAGTAIVTTVGDTIYNYYRDGTFTPNGNASTATNAKQRGGTVVVQVRVNGTGTNTLTVPANSGLLLGTVSGVSFPPTVTPAGTVLSYVETIPPCNVSIAMREDGRIFAYNYTSSAITLYGGTNCPQLATITYNVG
jgi:formylmethanofuran dehydrogenase subunit C